MIATAVESPPDVLVTFEVGMSEWTREPVIGLDAVEAALAAGRRLQPELLVDALENFVLRPAIVCNAAPMPVWQRDVNAALEAAYVARAGRVSP